jgi:hypothetical protein
MKTAQALDILYIHEPSFSSRSIISRRRLGGERNLLWY